MHAYVALFNQLKLDPPYKLRKVHPDGYFPRYVFTLRNCENNKSTQITYTADICFGTRAQLAINNKVNVSDIPHLQWSKQTTTLYFLLLNFFSASVSHVFFVHLQNKGKEDINNLLHS